MRTPYELISGQHFNYMGRTDTYKVGTGSRSKCLQQVGRIRFLTLLSTYLKRIIEAKCTNICVTDVKLMPGNMSPVPDLKLPVCDFTYSSSPFLCCFDQLFSCTKGLIARLAVFSSVENLNPSCMSPVKSIPKSVPQE